MCVEDDQMTPDETRVHLLAWTQARPDTAAAAELSQAMLEDDDPALWALGLDALAMLDPAAAVPAVRRLRSHRDLGPLATEWLHHHGKPDAPQR